MKRSTELSIIIPAYNESNRIVPTLEEITDYFKNKSYKYEVIVVDDGSSDGTVDTVHAYNNIDPCVRVESYGKNRGKGYAVRYGMLRAQGDYSLFIDADGAISIDHFDMFFAEIERGNDIVIGSIELPGHVAKDSNEWYRRILGRLAKILIRFTATPGIHDTQRAFKLFKKDAALEIFQLQTIEQWGFDIEILVIARKLEYKIKELPVTWINAEDSRVTGLAVYARTLMELFSIINKSFLGYYTPDRRMFESRVQSNRGYVRS